MYEKYSNNWLWDNCRLITSLAHFPRKPRTIYAGGAFQFIVYIRFTDGSPFNPSNFL